MIKENEKNEIEVLKKTLNTLKGKLTTLESKKKEIEANTKELIGKTVYEKKQGMERSFDEIIKEAEQRLKVSEKEKAEERKKHITKIIEQNTRQVRENNIYLSNEITKILKENKLPGFVNSNFYYSLWYPDTIIQKLICVAAFIIILLIPTILCFVVYKSKLESMFPNNIFRVIIKISIYLVSTFIFSALWLLIDKITKAKIEIIKEVKELRKNIDDNKKEIQKISLATNKEMTDDKFDYTKIDREIEANKIEIEKYKTRKKEAIEKFITVTQDEIAKTIENETYKDVNVIDIEIEKTKRDINETQIKYDEYRMKMATE